VLLLEVNLEVTSGRVVKKVGACWLPAFVYLKFSLVGKFNQSNQ
jgi:hypothetical protein